MRFLKFANKLCGSASVRTGDLRLGHNFEEVR